MDKLLKLLDTNARLTNAQLAVMLDTTEEAVAAQIADWERSGVIRAYKALIDWDRTDREYVTAIIEQAAIAARALYTLNVPGVLSLTPVLIPPCTTSKSIPSEVLSLYGRMSSALKSASFSTA